MKIFFPIGAFYPSQLGGPNNTVYWMTKALVNKGVDVEIVTTHRGVAEDSGIKLNDWIDLGYGKIKYLRVLHRLLPVRLYYNSLKPIMRSDIIHLTSLFYSGSLIIALTSLLLKKQIVWSVRGELSPSALKFKSPFKAVILKVIKSISRRITFHGTSAVEIDHIESCFGISTRSVLIPNYMELPKPILYNEERKYFLFLGRIHAIKALDNLIKALFKSDKFMKSDFYFKIAGEDRNDFGDKLKKLISELNLESKVQFEGFVYRDMDKQELLAKSYFLILPSHTENFGNVVIESLAQGTPVIASKGTPWESLENKKSGYWTNNNPEHLSQIIDTSLNLKNSEYVNMRANALKHVSSEYSVDNNIPKWISTYQNCLNIESKI